MVGTYRDAVASTADSSKCDDLRNSKFDLDLLFKALRDHSETMRRAYDARRRQVPGLTIVLGVDFDLRPDAGGGTTEGHCGDTTNRILIDPVYICKNPTDSQGHPRDLIRVFIHELGHVLLCPLSQPSKPPGEGDNSAEENAVHDFVDRVESELYPPAGPRDPFKAPRFISPQRGPRA